MIRTGIRLWSRVVLAGLCLTLSAVSGSAATICVWTNGTQTAPYDNWGNAFTDIVAAASYAGSNDVVWVTNGVYRATNQVNVANAITVLSVSGASSTTIYRATNAPNVRVLYLNHALAVLDGFTVTNGSQGLANGGGVYVNSGTVRNCIISLNSCNNGGNLGGGVYVAAASGLVSNCVIMANRAYGGGGGVAGGTVVNCTITANSCVQGYGMGLRAPALARNCLVAGNSGLNYDCFAGGVYGGIVLNSTIANNAIRSSGGGVYDGVMTNCIVYNNTAGMGIMNYAGAPTFAYCCVTPLPAGTSNTAVDPHFVNAAAGNYRLIPGSPCVDTGTNGSWTTGDKDLDGNNRLLPGGGTVDMGAYEFNASALACGFVANVREGLAPLTVVITGTGAGTNTTGLHYAWDLNNDGTVDQPDNPVVTNTYQPGRYAVSLVISNAAGEVAARTNLTYILAAPSIVYVATSGGNSTPFTNWATAATSLYAAIDLCTDGSTVLLSNGTFAVTSQVWMTKAITVQGVTNAPRPNLQRTGTGADQYRLFLMTQTNDALDGVQISNGSVNTDLGGGVWMNAGLIRNCTISGNSAPNGNQGGGGIYMTAGVVSNCLVTGNFGYSFGGGVRMTGGSVVNCAITNNTTSASGFGGGLYGAPAGAVRGCLIAGNKAGTSAGAKGGGAYQITLLESCTVSGNSAYQGGGVSDCPAVTNSIAYFNTAANGIDHNYYSSTFRYCCMTPLATGAGNTNGDPLFVNAVAGNYRLGAGSPCLDAGTNFSWMDTAKDLDGADRIYPSGGTVDMGAYEAGAGPLGCSIVGVPGEGFAPLTVTFTAAVSGGNTNGLHFTWDVNNDGTVDQPDNRVVTNTYVMAGSYSVSLAVSNSVGEVAFRTNLNYILAAVTTAYVATNGTHTSPFTNWVTAATNIQAAVNLGIEGSAVWVSNGTYISDTDVTVGRGMTVKSVNGAGKTVVGHRVGAPNSRVLTVKHPAVLVDGFTMINGLVSTVDRSDVSDTGGGLWMNGGIVQNCVIANCAVASGGYSGGGVYMSGGLLLNCVVQSNSVPSSGHGGGIRVAGGLVRNCIVCDNCTDADSAGMQITAGAAESCTIVTNRAGGALGGTAGGVIGGSLTNCIVYFNAGGTTQNWAGCVMTNCCTTPTNGLPGEGNIGGDPLFVNLAARNLHLQELSPCINAGTNMPWMLAWTDADGKPRQANKRVDIGAYESPDLAPHVILIVR